MFLFTAQWAKRSWPFNLDLYAGDVHTLLLPSLRRLKTADHILKEEIHIMYPEKHMAAELFMVKIN